MEYHLSGLASLASNPTASWQVIDRLTTGDHQVQRINLTGASGSVSGSFALDYDGTQVTVAVGADDAATRGNIEAALNGITTTQVTVAVAQAGAGLFDIRFTQPGPADVKQLVLGGVGGLAGLTGTPDVASLDYAIERTGQNYAVFSTVAANDTSSFYIGSYMAVDKLGPRLVEKDVWDDLDGDGTVEKTGRTDFFEDPT